MGVGSDKVEQVKKILIPKYFDEIVIPEMEGYYSDYTVDFESRPVAKCPLHGEDTPSFRWYEETNTFFCFGCRAGGDVIQLHRKFMLSTNGIETQFNDAVEFLYNYFVQGVSTAVAVEHKAVELPKKSSVPEMIIFSKYVKGLEEQLMADIKMPIDIKKKIYEAVDTTSHLTALDIINAIDAMSYIKKVVQSASQLIH